MSGTAATTRDTVAADEPEPAGGDQATTETRRWPLRLYGYRALVLFGLAGVAITQPMLDLLGDNPEFFVAGSYTRRQIVMLGLVVTVVPGLMIITLTCLAGLIHRRAGTVVYRAGLFLFAAMFVLVLVGEVGLDLLPLVVLLAVAGGVGAILLERSSVPVRRFLTYLCLGQVIFLGLFFFGSRTSDLLSAGGWSPEARGSVSVPRLDGPVVLVVLDELPVATLLEPDGTVNAERYPGFARLADSSTFFRNASSSSSRTHLAMPELLTGRLTSETVLPTYHNYERNLFTLLGFDMPTQRYEVVTDLCPPEVCEPKPPESLSQALRDSSVIYGHRVLPSSLRSSLPDIDQSWGNFGGLEDDEDTLPDPDADPATTEDDTTEGDEAEGGQDADGEGTEAAEPEKPSEEELYARWRELGAQSQRGPRFQAEVVETMGAHVTSNPGLHVIHVALPHAPWTLAPSGYSNLWAPSRIRDPEAPNYEWHWRQVYQLHSLQVGAADRVVDRLIDQLQEADAWDDALVVVTSDHGVSLLPPDYGRTLTENNAEGVLRMPLFIKAPGQTEGEGEALDDVAQTIDIVPSVIDLLDIRTDWEMDGHSLFDGSRPTAEPKVSPDVGAMYDLVERHTDSFPHGSDWFGLAGVGEHGDLVGRPVDELDQGEPSAWSWTVNQRDELDDLPAQGGKVPFILSGEVRHATDRSEPPELVVALNGTLAGVAGGYVPAGDGTWTYDVFLADLYRDGANQVAAFEVERSGDSVVLHPVPEAG